jgi:predicted lipase
LNYSEVEGFRESEAKRYLLHSFTAYCSKEIVEQWNCEYCTNTSTTFEVTYADYSEETDTFVYVGYDSADHKIIVTYRGSVPSIKNWVSNLKAGKYALDIDHRLVVGIHAGFRESYESHRWTIIDEVLRLRRRKRRPFGRFPTIVLTGHSLGGALSTITALDLVANHDLGGVYLYTYGSPRVFQTESVVGVLNDYINSGKIWSYRITNQRDIVPHLPTIELGFQHIPSEVFYMASPSLIEATYQLCDGSGEDPKCANMFHPTQLSIGDHFTYMGIKHEKFRCRIPLAIE